MIWTKSYLPLIKNKYIPKMLNVRGLLQIKQVAALCLATDDRFEAENK